MVADILRAIWVQIVCKSIVEQLCLAVSVVPDHNVRCGQLLSPILDFEWSQFVCRWNPYFWFSICISFGQRNAEGMCETRKQTSLSKTLSLSFTYRIIIETQPPKITQQQLQNWPTRQKTQSVSPSLNKYHIIIILFKRLHASHLRSEVNTNRLTPSMLTLPFFLRLCRRRRHLLRLNGSSSIHYYFYPTTERVVWHQSVFIFVFFQSIFIEWAEIILGKLDKLLNNRLQYLLYIK